MDRRQYETISLARHAQSKKPLPDSPHLILGLVRLKIQKSVLSNRNVCGSLSEDWKGLTTAGVGMLRHVSVVEVAIPVSATNRCALCRFDNYRAATICQVADVDSKAESNVAGTSDRQLCVTKLDNLKWPAKPRLQSLNRDDFHLALNADSSSSSGRMNRANKIGLFRHETSKKREL
jgi:hypothetical protein